MSMHPIILKEEGREQLDNDGHQISCVIFINPIRLKQQKEPMIIIKIWSSKWMG